MQFLRSPFLDLLTKTAVAPARTAGPQAATASVPAGPDCFKSISYWQSQNPYNDPKVGWAGCCATVKKMMEAHYGKGKVPNVRYDLVQEHQSTMGPAQGYRVRTDYVAAPNAVKAAKGLLLLDEYMALHKPVMVGVSHTFAAGYNDGTIDHFVAIVGVGQDKNGKYYRFFDVGTTNRERGTSPNNRLYLQKSGFYEGTSKAMPGKTYILTQLRFF